MEFLEFVEFVELIWTETRRLVETNRDTIEIQWREWRLEMIARFDGWWLASWREPPRLEIGGCGE